MNQKNDRLIPLNSPAKARHSTPSTESSPWSMNNIVNMDPPFSRCRQFVCCRFLFLVYQDQHVPISQSAGTPRAAPPPPSFSRDGGPVGVESPPLTDRYSEEHGPTSSSITLVNEFQDVEAEGGATTPPQGPPRRRNRSQASVVPSA